MSNYYILIRLISTLEFLVFLLINDLTATNMIINLIPDILANILLIKFVRDLIKDHLVGIMFSFHSLIELIKFPIIPE